MRTLFTCLLLAAACTTPSLAQTTTSCQQTKTFLKHYGRTALTDWGLTLCPAQDGHMYAAGLSADSTFIMKLNSSGTVIWTRTFLPVALNRTYISALIEDSEGMLAGAGTVGEGDNGRQGYAFRYDPVADTLLWSKLMPQGNQHTNDMLEKSPGGNYLLGTNPRFALNVDDAQLWELNRLTGTLVGGLTKRYNLGSSDAFEAMTIHEGALYTVGRYTTVPAGVLAAPDKIRSALTRFDLATGLPVWARLTHVDTSAAAYLTGQDLVIDGQAILSITNGLDNAFTAQRLTFFLQKTTLDGDVVWVKKYATPDNVFLFGQTIVVVPDGYLIYGVQATDIPSARRLVMKTDKDGQILWTKVLTSSAVIFNQVSTASPNGGGVANGYAWFIGSAGLVDNDVFILKMDGDGQVSDSCSFLQPFTIVMTEVLNPVSTPVEINAVDALGLLTNAPRQTTATELSTVAYCLGCAAVCNDTLDLGPDVVLCQDSTITFHAGSGFASYLWQDGSTDSTYTTSAYDLYWVEVTDSCGGTQRDSVLITVSLLGDTQYPDTVLCAGDSLTIAVTGFDAYLWTPAAALSCDTCATVVLQPTVTTLYTLYATTTDGCVLRDTFEVAVLPLPIRTEVIEFAAGDTVTLDGTPYTQPTTVVLTLPATVGCDTVVTYLLQLQTMITIDCPNDLTVNVQAGEPGTVVDYGLPLVSTTCPDSAVTYTLLSGLPVGGTFPVGVTEVCYGIADACGNDTTCCFQLTVVEQAPACDVKTIGCLRYELLSIKFDALGQRRYAIRVTNYCAEALVYTAFELPGSITAVAPADGSVYTAASGRSYDVRNPNASPFHSIRFKAKTGVLLNLGASDIFRYTLPNLSAPQYIHVTARLASGQFFPAILNTFYCPVQPYPNFASGPGTERAVKSLAVYPNPTDGVLIADCSSWAGQLVQIQIVNAQGQRVFHQSLTAEYAPQALGLPASLANGLYFLEVQAAGEQRSVQRFVVQR